LAGGIHKLKPRTIQTVRKPGLHSDGGGLYLSVSKTGAKSWTYIWIKQGKRRQMGLGGLNGVPVDVARAKALKARQLVAQGRDPIKERKRQVVKTFEECAAELINTLKPSWKGKKSLEQWTRTVEVYCVDLLPMDIEAVDTEDVLKALKEIWQEKPETARRVRSRTARIIDYAISKKWRKADNPARWKNHLENLLTPQGKRGHFAALPYQLIPKLIGALHDKYATSALALEFTILTAMRTTEVLEAVWTEIDFDKKLWIVPAERMKGGEQHEVPLTSRLLEILKEQNELNNTGFIFSGMRKGNPLSNMAMSKMLKGLTVEKCTVHGMRSSFRDYCGDMTNFPREIAEAALAHKVGSKVEQSYRRGSALEKRRQLMQLWCDYCNGNIKSTVVKITGGQL